MRHDQIKMGDMDILLGDSMKSYNPFDLTAGDNHKDVFRKLKYVKRAIKILLTGRQRECILMRYIEGKSNKEISELLGLHPSTVSRHIHRGIAKIRKFYALVDDGISEIEQDLADV